MSGVASPQSATAVGIVFPIIDGVLVALRFYMRRERRAKFQLDDWLCIPAWFCLTGCCASLLAGVFTGAFADPPPDPVQAANQQHVLAQVTAALVILWMGANFLIKLIMLLFYRRIFIGQAFNYCNWTLVGLSVVWFIYAILSWLLYCGTNLEDDIEGPWTNCPSWGFEIQMGVFALDSFIDFCLLILPIPFVWRLQLDLKRKVGVIVVFLLGGFAFVAGLNNTIVQLAYLTNPALFLSSNGANFFQASSIVFSNWPAIEIGVGLLASNLPHLSFRLARLFSESLPQALRLSLASLRHAAAAAISLTSMRRSNGSGSGSRSRFGSRAGSAGRGTTRDQQAAAPQPPSLPKQEGEGSTRGLWVPDAASRAGGSDDLHRAKSLGQSSGQSVDVVEMGDLEAGKSAEDAA